MQLTWSQLIRFAFVIACVSVTCKKSPNVYKSCPKRILQVKWKILTNLQKFPIMCWQFGQNNCCHGLLKVAKRVINCPIWSHCLCIFHTFKLLINSSSCLVYKLFHFVCRMLITSTTRYFFVKKYIAKQNKTAGGIPGLVVNGGDS